MDKHYKRAYTVKAMGGLEGDLHEFQITEDDTVLITVYQIIQYDMTPVGGKKDGYIWDCLIQEIDIENNELLFQWRASEHYPIDATYRDYYTSDIGMDHDHAWDYFHMNSIQKDPWGNYLMSARYTHSLTYIDGTNGEIIWIMGGKYNEFHDLSRGTATNFYRQHDARWRDNYTSITMFDNREGEASRGMWLDVDTENMTVKLRTEYWNPDYLYSESQGSLQVLPSGNIFIGYGHSAAFTEFAPTGEVLCNVHFASGGSFDRGGMQSYRAFKKAWVGQPQYPPSVMLEEEVMYVSWNGATEVVAWVLEGADSSNEDAEYSFIKMEPKKAFEAVVPIDEGALAERYRFLRFTGVDINGNVLGHSAAIEIKQRAKPSSAPVAEFFANEFTISWPGVNGVFMWVVEGTDEDSDDARYTFLKMTPQLRETMRMSLQEVMEPEPKRFVRFIAVNYEGDELARTRVLDTNVVVSYIPLYYKVPLATNH